MGQSVLTFVGPTAFAAPNIAAKVDVIFVHGLSGDKFETWKFSSDASWPHWLAEDFTDANIYCAGYESKLLTSAIKGGGASLFDRATILMDSLLSCRSKAPQVVLVGHSLGGLIIKQMLRKLNDSAKPEAKVLLGRIAAVIFIATPHQGAKLASSLTNIASLILSTSVKELEHGNNAILDLGDWFENWTQQRALRVAAYYETKKTKSLLIVDKTTANPHANGCDPIAIDADHLEICKPATRESQLYVSVSAIIKDVITQASSILTQQNKMDVSQLGPKEISALT